MYLYKSQIGPNMDHYCNIWAVAVLSQLFRFHRVQNNLSGHVKEGLTQLLLDRHNVASFHYSNAISMANVHMKYIF